MAFGAIKSTAEDAQSARGKLDEKSVLGDEKNNEKIEDNEARTGGKIKDTEDKIVAAEARVNERILELRNEHGETTKLYRGNDHKIFDVLKSVAVALGEVATTLRTLVHLPVALAKAETEIINLKSDMNKMEGKIDLILSKKD